jgi:beta-lactamase regulating signal transducer with metallopeptidase domain
MNNITNTTNNLSAVLPEGVSNIVSFLIGIIGAVGGFVIIYLLFQIINFKINKKKKNEIIEINKNLQDIKNLLKKKK